MILGDADSENMRETKLKKSFVAGRSVKLHRHYIVKSLFQFHILLVLICILFVCLLCLFVTFAGGAVICDALQRLSVLPLQVAK
jgi:Flp pilus assembly protein TadB